MKVYYLYDGKQQHGPYSVEELKDKSLNKNTLVWTDQLTDWTKAGDIDALKSLFTQAGPKGNAIPPPPPKQHPSPANSTNSRRLAIAGVLVLFIIAAGFFMLRPKDSKKTPVTHAVILSSPKLDPVKEEVIEPLPPEMPVTKELSKTPNNKFNPAKYIQKTIKIRKNFVGQTIIEGTIKNTSSSGMFKDVVLNVEYLSKTGSTISTQKFVVYEIARPNKRIPFKFKTRAPYGTATFTSAIVDATPIN